MLLSSLLLREGRSTRLSAYGPHRDIVTVGPFFYALAAEGFDDDLGEERHTTTT